MDAPGHNLLKIVTEINQNAPCVAAVKANYIKYSHQPIMFDAQPLCQAQRIKSGVTFE